MIAIINIAKIEDYLVNLTLVFHYYLLDY